MVPSALGYLVVYSCRDRGVSVTCISNEASLMIGSSWVRTLFLLGFGRLLQFCSSSLRPCLRTTCCFCRRHSCEIAVRCYSRQCGKWEGRERSDQIHSFAATNVSSTRLHRGAPVFHMIVRSLDSHASLLLSNVLRIESLTFASPFQSFPAQPSLLHYNLYSRQLVCRP
jgi:hypothetical protein